MRGKIVSQGEQVIADRHGREKRVWSCAIPPVLLFLHVDCSG